MLQIIGWFISTAVVLQFRKFQQALEEEFGDDIEIVSILTMQLLNVNYTIKFLTGWNCCQNCYRPI